MPWPQAHDFQDAVLNPESSFRDEDLRVCQVVKDTHGLPIPASGQFGIVYQMVRPDGRRWAIKCFTADIPGRNDRYKKISARLRNTDLPFMVGFDYLEQGVYIGGQWYPIQKMEWVEGLTLNKFVGERLDRPQLLRVLTDLWLKVAKGLRDTRITHADLQHGNVMLVPGKAENRASLKLVDYDGMYLAELAGTKSGEVGHPSYQHPRRLAEGLYGPDVDRFSHLVIYTGVKALVAKGRTVWHKYNHGDNLLFTPTDFAAPRGSKVLHELWADGSADVRTLAGRLVLATQQPLAQIPELEQVVQDGVAVPLETTEHREVDRILGIEILAATPRPIPMVTPVAVAAGAPKRPTGRSSDTLPAQPASPIPVRREVAGSSSTLWIVLGGLAVIVVLSLLLVAFGLLVWAMSRLPAARRVVRDPPPVEVAKGAPAPLGPRTLLDMTGNLRATDPLYFDKRHNKHAINCAQGKTYVIDMQIAGKNPMRDPYLILLDPGGNEVARDDDGGGGLNARITYRAQQTGQFQIVATNCFGNDFGTYTLKVVEQN
jgi:hypothetical protein